MQARIDRVAGPVNTWVIGDDDEVIVIDPGESAEAVMNVVGQREVLAVICTHGHVRHVAAAKDVASRDEAPVALHGADRLAWREANRGTARVRSSCTARNSARCSPATSSAAAGRFRTTAASTTFPASSARSART